MPSQKKILINLEKNLKKLRNKGIKNLLQLQAYLKNKKNYPSIASEARIEEDYLVILNRMVNSYVVKVLSLDKIQVFTSEELAILADAKITNTKQYYEYFTKPNQIENMALQLDISDDQLEFALRIIDLLRINGVGVDYAKILYKMGIKSVADYKKISSKKILESFNSLNLQKEYTRATIGITDIEYCRRFCDVLDCDLQ